MGLGSWPELWLPLAACVATVVVSIRGLITLRHLDSSRAADPEAVWPEPQPPTWFRPRWRLFVFVSVVIVAIGATVAIPLVLSSLGLAVMPSLLSFWLLAVAWQILEGVPKLHRRGIVSRVRFVAEPLQLGPFFFLWIGSGLDDANPFPPLAGAVSTLIGGIACASMAVAFWRVQPRPWAKPIWLMLFAVVFTVIGADAVARHRPRRQDPVATALDRWLESRNLGGSAPEWEILADAVEHLRSHGKPVPPLDHAAASVAVLRKGPKTVDGGAKDAIVRIGLAAITDLDPRGEDLRLTPFWRDIHALADLPFHIAELRKRLVLGGIVDEDRVAVATLCLAYLGDDEQERLSHDWTVVRMLDMVLPGADLGSVRPAIETKLEARWVEATGFRRRSGFSWPSEKPSTFVVDYETWAAVALIERSGARPAIDFIALRKSLSYESMSLFGLQRDRLVPRLSLALLDRAGIVIPGWPWPTIAGWLQVVATLLVCTLYVRVICGAPAIPLPPKPFRPLP